MKTLYRNLTVLLILLAALTFVPSYNYYGMAASQSESLDEDEIEGGDDYVEGQLIVKLKPRAGNRGLQNMLAQNNLSLTDSVPGRNLVLVEIPDGFSVKTFKEILSRNPDVEYVEKNYMYHALQLPNDPYYSIQYHHTKIESPLAWDTVTGSSSVVIAVLDTGVQSNHPDLSGKVLVGQNFVGSTVSTNTNDVNGHGTGVAGAAAAKTNNSAGVAGVCWGCQILPVKVLGDNGSGTLFDIIEGINFVANYALSNPGKKVIINLSLGGSCSSSSSEQTAINNAWNRGVVIIAAAGNGGNSTPQCPAARGNVVAVSATDQSDKLATFSSFGSYVDVSAPGVRVVTTWKGSSYVYANGTSFSSPITAGVAGLVWSRNPGLTNAQLVQLIQDTADDLGSQGYDTQFGHGRVNANTAIQATLSPTPTPIPSPTPTPTPTPTTSSDTIRPTVTIAQPANGTYVWVSTTIIASASDNRGVAKVEFYVDGQLLGTDNLPPYSAVWNSSTAIKGIHTIKAIATDTSGNTASAQVSVSKLF